MIYTLQQQNFSSTTCQSCDVLWTVIKINYYPKLSILLFLSPFWKTYTIHIAFIPVSEHSIWMHHCCHWHSALANICLSLFPSSFCCSVLPYALLPHLSPSLWSAMITCWKRLTKPEGLLSQEGSSRLCRWLHRFIYFHDGKQKARLNRRGGSFGEAWGADPTDNSRRAIFCASTAKKKNSF